MGKVFATLLLIVATFLVTGCEKDNDNNVKLLPISCTVDLHGTDRNGLSVMSIGSGFSLLSDSSQLMVQESDMPQLLVVFDENEHVRMLYRDIISSGQSIMINVHSTALAMVTCNPTMAMIGDSNYSSIVAIIENLQSFSSFENYVRQQVADGNDLFDTANTQMFQLLQAVNDELLETTNGTKSGTKDSDPMPWADYAPLKCEWVTPSISGRDGAFYLSNFALVPSYYGTLTSTSGVTQELKIPTVDRYTLGSLALGVVPGVDVAHGQRVLVTLSREANNTIELTNLHDYRAVLDFGAHFLGDIITALSLPVDIADKDMVTLAQNVGSIVVDAITDDSPCNYRTVANTVLHYTFEFIAHQVEKNVLEASEKAWAKKMCKIGMDRILAWYNTGIGLTNLVARITYWAIYPNDISFCAWYGREESVMRVTECKMDDWVDLGLPSGLLWATRNVGATSPEDYGDYFAWGETQPKEVYDWSTYQYCVERYDYYDNGYSYVMWITKYHPSLDNLTILQPSDDAATVNYGGRTPTKEEWQELIDHTSGQWTSRNGVNGLCFTGPNGNSIFLPAAGYCWESSLNDFGSTCYYWSSSRDEEGPEAWHWSFYLNWMEGGMSNYKDRSCGLSVRAVRSAR